MPPFAGQGQFFGQVAALEVENAVGQRPFLSLFEPVPNPADKFGHGRHGARNDVVESLRQGLDPHAAGREVRKPEARRNPFDHGYLLAEGLLYSFPTALTSVPFSIIQAVGSAIIYYIAAPALDKVKFKTKLS